MAPTTNPLQEMSRTVNLADYQSQAPRPDESFQQSSLPGFHQALHARRAMREFDGTGVPEAIMRECLHDATLAPSSSNLQVYELYWVRDADKKARIAEACLAQPAATTAGEIVVVVARGDLWRRNLDKLKQILTHGGSKPLRGPLAEYYEKIVPMVLRSDPIGVQNFVRSVMYAYKGRTQPFVRTPVNRGDHRIYAHVQATFAAQTLMLSVAAHGFESCPIGGFDKKRIARQLALPGAAEVSLVVAIGRGVPSGLMGPRVRLPDEDLIKEV